MCRDSMMGLPLCSVSRRATSSICSTSRSPSFHTSRPRSRADILPHGPLRAARAAATAASTSDAPADATSAITSSVAGLTTGIVLPSAASCHAPPINSCFLPSMVALDTLSAFHSRCCLDRSTRSGPADVLRPTQGGLSRRSPPHGRIIQRLSRRKNSVFASRGSPRCLLWRRGSRRATAAARARSPAPR